MRSLFWRLVLVVPTLFGVALVAFVVLRVVPGDPISMMIPPGAGEEDIARLRAHYGLDSPLFVQFALWLGQLVQGDLGTSISLRQGVGTLILGRLPATAELVLVAVAVAFVLGLGVAVAASLAPRRVEAMLDGGVGFTLAIPDFIWGLVFILLLGVLLPIFPVAGRFDPRLDADFTTPFFLLESIGAGNLQVAGTLMSHLVLPALALALPLAAILARTLKNALYGERRAEYAVMAQARGESPLYVVTREALPNALIPTLTLAGVQTTFLIGGTVLIEQLFSYPGIGSMAVDAIINRDLPLIQGLVLTFALLFISINLVVDALCTVLDPRQRHA